MVLLPTPSKPFAEVMPEVKRMLKACALQTCGWPCDHEALADGNDGAWATDPTYSASRPKKDGDGTPPYTIALTSPIAEDADQRLAAKRCDLTGAGEHYPRAAAKAALDYRRIAD